MSDSTRVEPHQIRYTSWSWLSWLQDYVSYEEHHADCRGCQLTPGDISEECPDDEWEIPREA